MSADLDLLRPGGRPIVHGKEAVRAITAASRTSFSAGMAILPKARRRAMYAVYAFCRVVDDIADGPFAPSEKLSALGDWRGEIGALYTDHGPADGISAALLPAIEKYGLPQEEFLLLVDGMEADAKGPIVAPSSEELSLYTRQVAGTVGLLSIRIFGAYRGEVSERFALALADALQLTNVLRDVEEDAALGRLYLPQDLLARHGLEGAEPLEVARSSRLPHIRAELGQVAARHYDTARRLAAEHDRRALMPALMMMGAYEGYLLEIKGRDWSVAGKRPLQTNRQKLLRGLRYALFGPGRPQGAAV
ncbi:MAG: squalene/phytoene synthase family protein [Parvularcula sp.]|jgi:phytoene synthase|nr:squalene/phytoene synthase family protein [Parvularcula sp.]